MAAVLARQRLRHPPHPDPPGAGNSHAVNPALAGVALAVVLGAIVAGSARNARTAVLGLILALVGASFVADPLPDTLALAGRLVGAMLGGYLLWVVSRGTDARTEHRTSGS